MPYTKLYQLLSLLAILLLCGTLPVQAASFKIDNNQPPAAGQELNANNDKGEVTASGVIEAASDKMGIHHSGGENVEILIEGKVRGTNGAGLSRPIRSDAGGIGLRIEIRAGAEIDSRDTSPNAHAIFSNGDDAIFTQSGGSITTIAHNAHGILSDGADAILTQFGGSITTAGNFAYGIFSNGADVTLIQSGGSITTAGNFAYGILSSGATATITQSGGLIETAGNFTYGIVSIGTAATITQSGGLIETAGNDAYGIVSIGTAATITQSAGSIMTSGAGAHGIVSTEVGDAVPDSDAPEHRITTVKGATIETSGTRAHGIYIGSNDGSTSRMVLNLGGDIKVTGLGSVGVLIADGTGGVSEFTVTGRIEVSGNAETAIQNSGNLPLTLEIKGSAVITGNILMGTGNDELVLSDNAVVTGDINMDTDDDKVIIRDHVSVDGVIDGGGHNVGDTLDISGLLSRGVRPSSLLLGYKNFETVKGKAGLPASVVTISATDGVTRLVYLDPTGYVMQVSVVGVLSNAIHNVVDKRLLVGAAAAQPVQVAANQLLPGMLFRDARPLVWAEFFGGGRSRGREKANLAYRQDYKGVVMGMEQFVVGDRVRAGFLFGYADGSVRTKAVSVKTTTDSFFGGIYGRFSWRGLNLGGSLNAGHGRHKNSRYFDGAWVKADYNSWFLSPSLTVGGIYPLPGSFELRPSASVNYTAGFYDDYRETGLDEYNLILDRRMAGSVMTRLAVTAAFMPDDSKELALRVGMSHRFTRSDKIEGNVSGRKFSFSATGDKHVYSAFVGLDLRWQLDECFSVLANTEYSHTVSGTSERKLSGSLTLEYVF